MNTQSPICESIDILHNLWQYLCPFILLEIEMADAAQELDSAIMLVDSAAKKLQAIDPGHELLQFFPMFDANWQSSAGFNERFGGERISNWARGTEFARAVLYMNYYTDLQEALKKSEVH